MFRRLLSCQIIFMLLMLGCAPAIHYQRKVAQGDKTWYTCQYQFGNGYVEMYDQAEGRVILYGNILIEDTTIPCKDSE